MNSVYPKIMFPKKRHFVQFADDEGRVYWMCLTEEELSRNKLAANAHLVDQLISSIGSDGFIPKYVREQYEKRFEGARR